MKNLLLVLSLLAALAAPAQNYQCLQSGVKHFFTNKAGYLRGIRIDSAFGNAAGDSVFYPFRCQRPVPPIYTGEVDTASGSWLGKVVRKQADGTYLFDNIWGDTIVIKTLAPVGATWTFYNDTGTRWYKASVTSIDTLTILGVLDSVKTIKLAAYNGSSADPADSMDNAIIILSKNYGLVQTFDMYTFPYQVYGWTSMICDWLLGFVTSDIGRLPGQASALFKLAPFKYPQNIDIYNFDVGDAFCSEFVETNGEVGYERRYTQYDSITAKTVIDPAHISYSVYSLTKRSVLTVDLSTGYGHFDDTYSATTNNWLIDSSITLDTIWMPEEGKRQERWHYKPDDSSRGVLSPHYEIKRDVPPGGLEHWVFDFQYKQGFPTIFFDTVQPRMGSGGFDWGYGWFRTHLLTYSQKHGVVSGSSCLSALDVPNVLAEQKPNIYPNPTGGIVQLQHDFKIPYTVTVRNLLGQALLKEVHQPATTDLDLGHLSDGTYIVSLSADHNQQPMVARVVVQH